MNPYDLVHALASQRWMITADGMRRIMAQLPSRDLIATQFAGDLFAARPEAIAARSRPARSGSVGVISVRGPIVRYDSWFTMIFGGTSVEWLLAQVRELASDESVGSILFDVDSPGGAISGLPELAATIRAARQAKPVSSVTNDFNASAAYWISAQADEISSTPEGLTGSVGIYTEHWDFSGMMAEAGIAHEFIQAGKFKTEGNQFEPLSDDARAHIQGLVDDGYALFLADVAAGRGVTVAKVRAEYGEGRVFAARDAKTNGLIDRVGSFADAVSRAATGKVSRRSARVVDAGISDPVALDDAQVEQLFAFERERRERQGHRPARWPAKA